MLPANQLSQELKSGLSTGTKAPKCIDHSLSPGCAVLPPIMLEYDRLYRHQTIPQYSRRSRIIIAWLCGTSGMRSNYINTFTFSGCINLSAITCCCSRPWKNSAAILPVKSPGPVIMVAGFISIHRRRGQTFGKIHHFVEWLGSIGGEFPKRCVCK
jgi:hypothetical protein